MVKYGICKKIGKTSNLRFAYKESSKTNSIVASSSVCDLFELNTNKLNMSKEKAEGAEVDSTPRCAICNNWFKKEFKKVSKNKEI